MDAMLGGIACGKTGSKYCTIGCKKLVVIYQVRGAEKEQRSTEDYEIIHSTQRRKAGSALMSVAISLIHWDICLSTVLGHLPFITACHQAAAASYF